LQLTYQKYQFGPTKYWSCLLNMFHSIPELVPQIYENCPRKRLKFSNVSRFLKAFLLICAQVCKLLWVVNVWSLFPSLLLHEIFYGKYSFECFLNAGLRYGSAFLQGSHFNTDPCVSGSATLVLECLYSTVLQINICLIMVLFD